MDKSKISMTNSSLLSCRCVCKGYENEEIIAEAGCSNDVAAVATLPDQWVPRHSGPVLAKYLKERENNHDKVNRDIADQSTDINTRIDAKIRDLVEMLLAHIKQNKTDLECAVEHVNTGKGLLTSQARAEALNKVSQLYTERIENIAAFRRDATTVERLRADGFRKIMRDQFQCLIAVGHLPPKDLLHDFDDRMYQVNQQLLSNFRAYHELEAQLHAEADEDVIKARSELNQLSLGIALTHRRQCPRPRSAEERRTSRRSTSNSEKKKRVSSVPCITPVLRYSEIEQCVSCLVDAYRKAVLNVFSGFSDKLTDLHKNLTCSNSDQETHLCETAQLQEMIECTLQHLASSFQSNMQNVKEFVEITQSDALNMKKSLFTVGDHLRDTYSILHDAAHLWDSHMMRSALAQKLTMAAVEDLITNNDSLEQANEINFNVALEQLRTTSEVEKLQPQHDALITMLDRIAEMYLLHCAAEIGRFEEFMNLPQLMANTLLAEYACFLEVHTRAVQVNVTLVPSGTETPWRDIYRRSPLPRALLQTELQVLALANWRNGFLEAFESNMSLVPEELTRQARQWVDERSAAIHMRYSVKMISHSIRMERLKYAHEIRLAELRHHEARLNSHLDAVYNLIDSLPEEASTFLALDAPELYPISDWVQRIQNDLQVILSTVDIDPEVKRLKMISYSPRLIRYRQLFESSLDEAIQLHKKNIEHHLQEVRVSNVRFMSQISLFKENGRYSAPEALKASAALLRVADALESCGNRTVDMLNHRRSQLLGLADQRIAPIQKTVEEFVKITVKSKGLEKKKPPTAKKK